MSRRKFLKQTSLASLGILSGPAFASAYDERYTKDIVIGHGDYRYKVDMHWGDLNPAVTPVRDCHEMVQDSQGRIVLLTNHTRNNVIIYDRSGKFIESWGTDYPGGHGLTLVKENGEDFLLITDYERHQIIKTTIDGKVIFEIDYPADIGAYSKKEEFKPTETTVLDNGDFYVADGYGNQMILHYNAKGELVNYFGGRGTEKHQFLNAHGICLDNRDPAQPCLLISARQQNQLKRFSLQGEYLSTVEVPGALICRPVIHGDSIYFAVLKSRESAHDDSGFLLIMDKNNRVVSCPGATFPDYRDGKLQELYQSIRLFQYPHDVCVDQDENIYVAQWNSGNTYPMKLHRV